MKSLARLVEDLLALHPDADTLVHVIDDTVALHRLREPMPGIVRGLKKSGDHRRLEGSDDRRPMLQLNTCPLPRRGARTKLTPPLGIHALQRLQAGDQLRGGGFAPGRLRPGADVALGGRLAPCLDLRDFRLRPSQRLRERGTAEPALYPQLSESLAERF